ncbi:MAG: S8 family serine peptidase, partial [Nitrososphaerales archaeon]
MGYNFYNNNNDWSDVCGHGTSVAGSAAAITNNGIGVSGVTWNNPIIPIKIVDVNCLGYYSSMINGIVYAADNGARVANISFQIFNGAALSNAAQYMNNHGGWVVAAAGNTGLLENYSENPYIISVGATGSTNVVTSWSSHGPYVDFAAPGSSIYTTKAGGTYGSASGTSFSSPIVAGVVALIISNNPSLNSQQVYDALKNSAVDLGSAGRDDYYGWGLVDAYGALLQNNPTPPPPDTTPPGTSSLLAPANGAVTNDNTPSFDWSDVTDPSLPVTYTLLADNNNDFSSPEISKQSLSSSDYTSVTSLAGGTYYWKVRVTDGAGNIGSYSTARTVTIDTTPPTITITNPQNGVDVTTSFTVSVSSSDNVAVNKVELYLDGIFYGQKTTLPYDFALDANAMSVGIHEIKAVSTDSSGNFNFATITVNVVRNSS